MSLIRNVGTIGGLTMVSRIFGFARDMLLARVLGAGGVADAWQLAFQLPNIFRRLFAEGAFAQAFVPLFNRRYKEDGGDLTEARQFSQEILAVLIPVLIVFSAIALIVMPWIMGLFASDALEDDADTFSLAVTMARLAFPYLALMSLATLLAAVLNSLSQFAAAAAAPIILNICLITALVTGATLGSGDEAHEMTGMMLAIAVTASGLFQLLWLGFWAWRAGFTMRIRPPRITQGVKELGVLVLPAVFGAGIYQISRFIDLFFISTLPDKSITFLAMADRLNQLPLGIVGIALGTAILPSLSRFIANEDADGALRLQSNAVELSLLLTLPAAAALFISGSAFTRAFYTGGAYTLEDSMATGAVVSALVVGLPAYVLVKVLVPNFFARKDTRTPVYTAAFGLSINIIANLILVPRIGVVGLALGGAIGAWTNCGLLYAILVRKNYYRLTAPAAGRIARIGLAAAIMGAALWFAMPYGAAMYSGSALERTGAIVALVAMGGAVFFSAAIALGVLNRETLSQLQQR
ncbi:MAG: murein biosynthesis integral membrane protein MurJ [Sphingomonadaceae bacterium]|nr:murein biosynthesis integral membrane protein MurJ [Sphingomonadaceae bacterium]